jgi:hypothetical protein
MGRPGWPLIVLLTLLGSYLAVAVAIAFWPSGEDVHGSGPKLHPPASIEERAAAGAGLAYLRALQRGDALAACRDAGGEVARLLRCDRGAPRIPRGLRPSGSLKAVDADVDGGTAGLGISSAGCVNFLSLRRAGGAWLVTGHHCGAYA